MNLILLKRIKNLGVPGDQVQVKPGYGRNYLIPRGDALPATPANLAIFEAKRGELEQAAAQERAAAQKVAQTIEGLSVTLFVQASEEGKMYGSVTPTEISEQLTQAGHDIDRHDVHMPNGPIKTLGAHSVQVHLHHGEVIASINVIVKAE